MPYRADTDSPSTTKALDDAFSLVLDQLANDLTMGACAESPASAQLLSAQDLRRVARFILEEAKRSSDRARNESLAVTAFTLAQLAEQMAVDGEERNNDSRVGTLTNESTHDRPYTELHGRSGTANVGARRGR